MVTLLVITAGFAAALLLGWWHWGDYRGGDSGHWIGFWGTVLGAVLATAGIGWQLRTNEEMERKGREGAALERLLETAWTLSAIEERHQQKKSRSYDDDDDWLLAYHEFKPRIEAWRMHSGFSSEQTLVLRNGMDELVCRMASGDPSLSKRMDYHSQTRAHDIRTLQYRAALRESLTYTVRRLAEALPDQRQRRKETFETLERYLRHMLDDEPESSAPREDPGGRNEYVVAQ